MAVAAPLADQLLTAIDRQEPLLSPDQVTIIFVLGGPGSGKGTQCAKLVQEFGFKHLSAGDLLRAEQDRPGSQFATLIKDCIKNGTIVPMKVTIKLLETAILETISSQKVAGFLIDGFPRKMDQAVKFEDTVCQSKFTLFFDCPEETMEERLLNRGKTSGRADDNLEAIKKRFKTFEDTTMPVVEYFEAQGRVIKISAVPGPDEVNKEVVARFRDQGLRLKEATETHDAQIHKS